MTSPLLEPLALQSIVKRDRRIFPYDDFSRQVEENTEKTNTMARPEPDRLQQLEKMLAEKHDRQAIVERDAYDKAYAAGEKAGLTLGRKRAEQTLEKILHIQNEAALQFDNIQHLLCEASVDIGAAIAAWLIGEITTEEKGRLLAVARKAAQSLPEVQDTIMSVHPDDLEQIKRLLEKSESDIPLRPDISVKPNSIRIFNKEQDVLVDPLVSIAEAVRNIKAELLSNDNTDHA
ncbi:MAG: hypothetical protein ACE5DY_01240 [Mariprofundaceae bacterium]